MDTTNLVVYHNGEVIRNTQEDGHVLKSINRILYRMPVQIFGEAIHFDTMAIVDEVEEDPEMDTEKQTILEENLRIAKTNSKRITRSATKMKMVTKAEPLWLYKV
ncbi:hypothetical protein PIB30_045983 [Stylosanthes scabra]|uniref:Uncharacterized protein n=1 Tax=Stylosanthes scabra TaxID=79078 RepID=A0ABU6TGQ9_9FABA|nr:hypothetical protein [Stylosanthes scabra]